MSIAILFIGSKVLSNAIRFNVVGNRIIANLSNNDGDGNENVTKIVKSRCF